MYRIYYVCFLVIGFLPNSLTSQADSLFIEHSDNSGLTFLYTLSPGSTIYGISQRLGVRVPEILKLNEGLNTYRLQPGEIIRLPLPATSISTSADSADMIPVFYEVKKSETLFRIAKIYAGIPVDEIMRLNGKDDTHLHPGDLIQLGYISELKPQRKSDPVFLSHEALTMIASDTLEIDSSLSFDLADVLNPIEKDTIEEIFVNRQGIAMWEQSDIRTTELLALHPTARVNSEIIIYNPMMNRSVKATVVSQLPENSYPNNISIVISPSVADALGALDRQFLVEMTYIE